MEKIRVLMAAPAGYRLVGGGAGIQMTRTREELLQLGVKAEFFTPYENYRPSQVDVVHVFRACPETHDLILRLRDVGFPVVLSPIFFTLRPPAFLRLTERLERLAKRFFKGIWTDYGIVGRACRMAQRVLPNTSEEARLIQEGFGVPPERIRPIPNGVDERFAHGDPELFYREYGVRDFILCVAHIGSLRKNVLHLIRALRRIDHPAVIIGKVFRNDYARRCLEEAAGNPRLRIIEGLPHDSPLLASAYAACRVFALPAYFETPGIAALEAALAGARIVITPHGGTRDYFGDEAIYVRPGSVASIARGIEAALNAPATERLRERIRREYLWPKVAEKTAAVYRELLEQTGKS